jgi:hypothetical protein
MTEAEFRNALAWGMGVCAFMIVVSLARYRQRGTSAYIQAASYAVMGALLYAVRAGSSQSAQVALGGALALLFVADFVARSGYGPKEPKS